MVNALADRMLRFLVPRAEASAACQPRTYYPRRCNCCGVLYQLECHLLASCDERCYWLYPIGSCV